MSLQEIDETQFNSAVLESKGVSVVKFGAEWCGPCRRLAPILESISSELDVKVYSVDVDMCPNLSAKFDIKGVPATMLFKDGELKKTIVGLTNKKEFVSAINSL